MAFSVIKTVNGVENTTPLITGTEEECREYFDNLALYVISSNQLRGTVVEASSKVLFYKKDLEDILQELGSTNPAKNTYDAEGKLVKVVKGNYNYELKEDGVVRLEGIKASPRNIILKPTDTYQINMIFNPTNATDKSLTYTSRDVEIATVSSTGLITCVKDGITIIKIESPSGWVEHFKVTILTPVTPNNRVESVSFNKSTSVLLVGQTETLTAIVSPSNATNKSGVWASSNLGILTVTQSGLVEGIATGIASVTFTTNDGNKIATCTYAITAPNVPVTALTLDKKTLSLDVGTSELLTAEILPSNATNKTVIWTSSDPTKATVTSSGQVAGLAVGTTNIVAKSEDGDYEDTCVVTVVASNVPVTGVTLNKNTSTVTVGNTDQLTATVAPANATNKSVTFTSSDPTKATVSSTGVVTGVAEGTATITVTTVDQSETDTCDYTVSN